jgi:CheY-like chemotaxis protein
MTRILLVEDDEKNRDMLTKRLRRRGYDVATAVDGAEACARVAAEPPDLILMDMQMPVMDGYEATRRLKDDPATRAIPIVGLTANAMVGDREKVLGAGCEEYEEKPITFDRLLEKIQALLERGGAS